MEQRLDYWKASPAGAAAFRSFNTYVETCGLEHSLLELVKTRASQINGCAYCLDMHTKDARAAGETEQRLFTLSAWRETAFFSDRERVALAWTEALRRINAEPDRIDGVARRHGPRSAAKPRDRLGIADAGRRLDVPLASFLAIGSPRNLSGHWCFPGRGSHRRGLGVHPAERPAADIRIAREASTRSEFVSVQHGAGNQHLKHVWQINLRDGEAAFATPDLSMIARHRGADIGRAVDDDGARFGVAVLRVETDKPAGRAMFAGVGGADQIGPSRRSVRPRGIGKPLQPAAMVRIGATPMGDEERTGRAADGADQMEARLG